MQSEERIRLWLAERKGAGEDGSVVLVYTTPDGGHVTRKVHPSDSSQAQSPTATIQVSPTSLTPVADADERVALSTEAGETRKRYTPDEPI